MQILLLFFLLVLLSLLASSCNEIWASNFGFQHWYLGLEGKKKVTGQGISGRQGHKGSLKRSSVHTLAVTAHNVLARAPNFFLNRSRPCRFR